MNLDISLQGDNFLQNKLFIACQDHLVCSIACSIPAITSTRLINNLRTSIVTYKALVRSRAKPNTFKTTRRLNNTLQTVDIISQTISKTVTPNNVKTDTTGQSEAKASSDDRNTIVRTLATNHGRKAALSARKKTAGLPDTRKRNVTKLEQSTELRSTDKSTDDLTNT
jgi:hypothetical protein